MRLLARLRALVVFSGVLSGVLGCGAVGIKEPKFIDDIRPVPPPFKVSSYAIQRRDLQDALSRSGDNTARLVPVFDNISVKETYSYRIFDVRDGSVYSLLGLQTSDVIIAVDRYLIKRPEQFLAFVSLLPRTNQATIEIRRGGEARLFKYQFIPVVAE